MESIHIRRGFTLVELMVVSAIIVIIMSIVLTGQSSFNKTIILQNASYDIALSLRNAETYGLGSRAAGITANVGYGVHVENAPAKSFVLFADTSPSPNASNCHGLPIAGATAPGVQPGDCAYSPGQDQKITEYTLGNGITISDFCAYIGVSEKCAVAHGAELTSINIVFARPNPDTFVRANGFQYTSACLTISSPQGGARFVSVAASGEITANATSCP